VTFKKLLSGNKVVGGPFGSNDHFGAGMKWIEYLYVSKILFILEIFGQQIAAFCCVGSGYDQGVPPGETIAFLNGPGTFQDRGACGD